MAICFPSMAHTAWGTFHLVLNFFFTLFHSSLLSGQCKYLSWNSARMARLTWGSLRGRICRLWCGQPSSGTAGRCKSGGQVSHGYGQFESNFQWLPVIGDFLMRCTHSSMRSKKAGSFLTKFWYPGMMVCMRSARRLL